MSEEGLNGKVVLVTGAGSGLGEATARAFASAGSSVVCVDVKSEGAQRVSQQIQSSGGRAMGCVADVSEEGSVSRVIDDAVRNLGGLDVAVNCAGIDHTLSVQEMTVQQWDQVIAVNLRGPFLISKKAFDVMHRNGGGHIVNVASTGGVRAWANAAAYHASKWGLIGFSRGLGVEGRAHGIRVTTVIPGGMRTNFFERFRETDIPMPDEQNLQDPANIAKVIMFAVQMPEDSALQEVIVTPLTETSWP